MKKVKTNKADLTDDQIQELIMVIVGELDYDLAKDLDPETAEEPEESERTMAKLVSTVREYLTSNVAQ